MFNLLIINNLEETTIEKSHITLHSLQLGYIVRRSFVNRAHSNTSYWAMQFESFPSMKARSRQGQSSSG